MKLLFFIFLILLVFLTACSAQPALTSPAETPPQSPPTETPFPIPSPTVNTQASEQTLPSGSEQLQSTTWQWTAFTSPVEQFDIETPENYLLTINDDGSLNIKADCNNASGNYTIDGSSLSIEVGPMTRAACPPGSLSDQFIKYLGFSAIYFFQDGNLFVDMMADGGTMEFAPADVPDDRPGSLVGTDWQWSAFTNPVEQFTVEDPQNYRLAFNDDGTLNIKADCNNASGSYTVDGSSLNIEIGPMTLAACPPGSLSDQFIKYLGFSAIYFFKDGNLFIDLFADGGTLELTPSG